MRSPLEELAARITETVQAKPAVIAAGGGATGLFTWLVDWAHVFSELFQLVAGFFGCLLALGSFLLVLPKLIRFFRAWQARGLDHADQE